MNTVRHFNFTPGGTAGQPTTTPPGGGYTPTRGLGMTSVLETESVRVTKLVAEHG